MLHLLRSVVIKLCLFKKKTEVSKKAMQLGMLNKFIHLPRIAERTKKEPCTPDSSCCSSKYQYISGLLSCYILVCQTLCCSHEAPVVAILSPQPCACFQGVFQAGEASSLPNHVVSLNAMDMHLSGAAPNRFQEESQSQAWELRKSSVTMPRPLSYCQQSALL